MLNWTPYNQHNWSKCKQTPLTAREKNQMEQLAARILWLPGIETTEVWGTVCPPGRNALVIQVHDGIRHQYEPLAKGVGVKLYNLGDGQVMWPSIFRFQQQQRSRMPGLPNPHVQEVLDCGSLTDVGGVIRNFLVQPWVEGDVLDQKMRSCLSGELTLQIVDDLFRQLIIPLWSKGSCWWDVRESNYVVTPAGRLVMIDSDTLGGYATEILETPTDYTKRNRGSLTAMRRYTVLLVKLAGALADRRMKSKVRREIRELVTTYLIPLFCAPYPLAKGWQTDALRAYETFRDKYAKLIALPEDHKPIQTTVATPK